MVTRHHELASQPRKVLFLDFDGVLHPAGDGIEELKGPAFVWLPLLEDALARHSNVGIVVSSTWRYTHSQGELRELLGSIGPRLLGAIPTGPRYEGIRWWLHLNRSFTSFRILDDQPLEFADPPPPELVLCTPSLGLTTPGVLEQLRSWLGSP